MARDSSIAAQTVFEDFDNCWTETEQALYEALPELAAYQSFVGAADAAEAATKTFLEAPTPPADFVAYDVREGFDTGILQAYAVVSSPVEEPYALVAGETEQYPEHSGTAIVTFSRLAEDVSTLDLDYERNIGRWIKNRAGTIARELWFYFKDQGGPHVQSIRVDGPFTVEEREKYGGGNWQQVEMRIGWGLGDQQ